MSASRIRCNATRGSGPIQSRSSGRYRWNAARSSAPTSVARRSRPTPRRHAAGSARRISVIQSGPELAPIAARGAPILLLPVPAGPEASRLLGQKRERRRVERDAVLPARVLEADLLLQDVLPHGFRVPRERIAPAAGPRVDVAEDVAALEGERAFRGQLLQAGRPGVQQVRGRRPPAPALEAVR